MKMLCDLYSKVSVGNSGQRLTPDTQHISAMNKSFGLKLEVVKHLPLGYLQTKNELTTPSRCDAGHRFILKTRAKTSKKTRLKCGNKQEFTSFIAYHRNSIESHQQTRNQ